jgi:hypothetical protein
MLLRDDKQLTKKEKKFWLKATEQLDHQSYAAEIHADLSIFSPDAVNAGRTLKTREWAHNGIRLPSPGNGEWQRFTNRRDSTIGAIFGSICLEDALRLDLNIARSKIVRVSPEARSAIILTTKRAAQRVYDNPGSEWVANSDQFISRNWAPEISGVSLGEYLADPLMTNDYGWMSEPLFALPDSRINWGASGLFYPRDLLSVNDILDRCGRDGSVFLQMPSDERAWALLRIHFEGRLEIQRQRSAVIRIERPHKQQPRPIDNGLLMFPPAIFLPYSDSDSFHLDIAHSTPINQSHPLADWYIGSAEVLNDIAPSMNRSFGVQLTELVNARKRGRSNDIDEIRSGINEMIYDLSIALERNGFAPYRGKPLDLKADFGTGIK